MGKEMSDPASVGGKHPGRMDMFARDAWVEALRSGKFTQGDKAMRRKLKGGDVFDPVGVLSELYRRETEKGQWVAGHKRGSRAGSDRMTFVLGKDLIDTKTGARIKRWWTHAPPPEVMQWADLHYRDATRIMAMSDRGKTFEEIADWIESNLQES